MTNHIHLLATGHERGNVSRMMHRIGTRFGRYINTARGRTGTLFEGRFRSSLVDGTAYTFICMRYIELNPVRLLFLEALPDSLVDDIRQRIATGHPLGSSNFTAFLETQLGRRVQARPRGRPSKGNSAGPRSS